MEGVRTQRWKYIRYFDKAMDQGYEEMLMASVNGEQPVYEELFDLEKDPVEVQNLIADPACQDILKSLRTKNAVLLKQHRGASPLNTYVETTANE
jgi:hypothetical protein